jgi:hypothetical protein
VESVSVTLQRGSVQLASKYVLEFVGLNTASGCWKHWVQGEHWTQQRSLPVSAIVVNFCAGVPRENCIRYSPLPADTGLCRFVASVSTPVTLRLFCSSLTRLWLRFTASRNLSLGDFVVALAWRLSLWTR